MPNIGAPELIIILVIALLILGPGKLPEVGASIGKSIREFRKASSDVQDAVKVDASPLPATPTDAATAAPAQAAAVAPVAGAAAAAAPVTEPVAAVEAPAAATAAELPGAPAVASTPAAGPASSEPTPGTN
jgi:TatA/E family protein of Tat protein translocase